MVMLILILFFCLPNNALSNAFGSFETIKLPSLGAEACTFDTKDNGPYCGLNDGRIVKYEGPESGFVEFATTVPNRSKEFCNGKDGSDPRIGVPCGRPLGLEFNQKSKELYFVDAYRGLMVVGSDGGLATQLVAGVNGVPFDFPDAIVIDPLEDAIYFTDVGSIFKKTNNMSEILVSGDTSGSLLKYELKTRRLTVVLTRLGMAAGVAISKDSSFLLITEYLPCKITRFWLKGPKANTSETFVEVPGNPDNIKTTESGDFWVAVNIQKLFPTLICFALGQKINEDGRILETVNFYGEYNATYITEIQQHLGSYYVASVYTDFVGVYKGLNC